MDKLAQKWLLKKTKWENKAKRQKKWNFMTDKWNQSNMNFKKWFVELISFTLTIWYLLCASFWKQINKSETLHTGFLSSVRTEVQSLKPLRNCQLLITLRWLVVGLLKKRMIKKKQFKEGKDWERGNNSNNKYNWNILLKRFLSNCI